MKEKVLYADSARCTGQENCPPYRSMVQSLREGRSVIDVLEDIYTCRRKGRCSRICIGRPEGRD
jgi:hypothetical protein